MTTNKRVVRLFSIKLNSVLDSELYSNCVCENEKIRVSVCWAAQREPRVEVVFLPPMVSLGLCVCVHAWGSLGPSEGAWGAMEGGMKREWDGGIGGQRGSCWERCRSGPMAKQKGGKESEMVELGLGVVGRQQRGGERKAGR